MTRHVLGLFQGMPGARAWRRHLSEHAHRRGAGVEVLEAALQQIPEGAGSRPHPPGRATGIIQTGPPHSP
jgi:hypothetical protein